MIKIHIPKIFNNRTFIKYSYVTNIQIAIKVINVHMLMVKVNSVVHNFWRETVRMDPTVQEFTCSANKHCSLRILLLLEILHKNYSKNFNASKFNSNSKTSNLVTIPINYLFWRAKVTKIYLKSTKMHFYKWKQILNCLFHNQTAAFHLIWIKNLNFWIRLSKINRNKSIKKC